MPGDQATPDETPRDVVGPASRRTLTPPPPPSSATATMRSNKARDTGPELRLRSALHALGYRYRVNYSIRLASRRVRPDLVFPRRHLAVFVDGCYWHRCPSHGRMPKDPTGYWHQKLARNVERDRSVTEELEAAGWTVLRVWEHVPVSEAVQLTVDAYSSFSPNSRAAPLGVPMPVVSSKPLVEVNELS